MTYLKVVPGWRAAAARSGYDFTPAVDVVENEDAFTLDFDLPGFGKDDIRITVNEGVLTVSGERKREVEDDEKYFRYFERTHGRFSRSFRLPDHVDGNAVTATYRNGVLTLEIPKKEEAKPYTIEIK